MKPPERNWNMSSRIVKAAFMTALMGVIWLAIWMFISMLPIDLSAYLHLFQVLVAAMLLFTFATTFWDGTAYKHVFTIIRAFFLIIYVLYASNFGFMTISYEAVKITVNVLPIVGLMVLANLLDAVKSLLQMLEFTSRNETESVAVKSLV